MGDAEETASASARLSNTQQEQQETDGIVTTVPQTLLAESSLPIHWVSSFKDWLRNRYYICNVFLGDGTFGHVYRVKCKRTLKYYALKEVRPDSFDPDEGIPSTVLREYAHLARLSLCPYIVPVHEFIISNNGKYGFIMSEAKFNLSTFLEKIKTDNTRPYRPPGSQTAPMTTLLAPDCGVVDSISWTIDTCKRFMWQLAYAVDCCHAHGVLHRDIKCQNILIDPEWSNGRGRAILADFGLTRRFYAPMRTYTTEICTLWYRPPEILLSQRVYSTAVDVWSLGCVFVEMIQQGQPLFRGDSQIDQLFQIFRLFGTPTESDWPNVTNLPDYKSQFPIWINKFEKTMQQSLSSFFCDFYTNKDAAEASLAQFIDLIRGMLQLNPNARITAEQVLQHEFFTGVPRITSTTSSSNNNDNDTTVQENTTKKEKMTLPDDSTSTITTITQNKNHDIPHGTTDSSSASAIAATEQNKADEFTLSDRMRHIQYRESYPLIQSDYFVMHPEINQKMRRILLDWLVEVHLKFKLLPETWYRCMQIIDTYLYASTAYGNPAKEDIMNNIDLMRKAVGLVTPGVDYKLGDAPDLSSAIATVAASDDVPTKGPTARTHLQLVGITAMFLAAKIEEVYPPECGDFVYISAQTYTTNQILQMERRILHTINATTLHGPIVLDFLRHITNKLLKFNVEQYYISRFLTEVMQITAFPIIVKYKWKPNEMAAACAWYSKMVCSRRQQQPRPDQHDLKKPPAVISVHDNTYVDASSSISSLLPSPTNPSEDNIHKVTTAIRTTNASNADAIYFQLCTALGILPPSDVMDDEQMTQFASTCHCSVSDLKLMVILIHNHMARYFFTGEDGFGGTQAATRKFAITKFGKVSTQLHDIIRLCLDNDNK